MKPIQAVLIACALAATATLATASSAASKSKYDNVHVRSAEIQPRAYRGFADPSFGPDGKPYPVPENLRGQCYIDMGYGRFQSCSNR